MKIIEHVRWKLANLLLRALRRLTRSRFSTSPLGEDPRDTAEGRDGVQHQMEMAVRAFETVSYQCGCAAFERFASVMHEFIKACHEAEMKGEPNWPYTDGKGGDIRIPLEPWRLGYLNEYMLMLWGMRLVPPPTSELKLVPLAGLEPAEQP